MPSVLAQKRRVAGLFVVVDSKLARVLSLFLEHVGTLCEVSRDCILYGARGARDRLEEKRKPFFLGAFRLFIVRFERGQAQLAGAARITLEHSQ